MSVNIILLAAGEGRRFANLAKLNNNIKQLAIFQGITLIEHTIGQLQPLISKINDKDTSGKNRSELYVCLGAHQNEITRVLPTDISILKSEHWQQGIGHSLADSVKNIADISSHILIALVDQPLVRQQHYQMLINESLLHPEKIIATLADNTLMPPIIFPQQYFYQLTELQGDSGAAKIIKQHQEHVITVLCNDAKFDVDTPEQLLKINKAIEQNYIKENLKKHESTYS